jgi:hypothetical protein
VLQARPPSTPACCPSSQRPSGQARGPTRGQERTPMRCKRELAAGRKGSLLAPLACCEFKSSKLKVHDSFYQKIRGRSAQEGGFSALWTDRPRPRKIRNHSERLRGVPAALSSAQCAFTRAGRSPSWSAGRAVRTLSGGLHVGLTMHAVPAPPCARAPPWLQGCLARVARDMTALRLFKRVLLMMVCAG